MSDNLLLQLAQAATEEQKACLLALAVLKNQPEATRRAALAAAVPHWFDAAVLAALLETPTPAPPLTQGRGESSPEFPPLSEGRGRGGVSLRDLNHRHENIFQRRHDLLDARDRDAFAGEHCADFRDAPRRIVHRRVKRAAENRGLDAAPI